MSATWTEENGVVTFSMTSDGTTGEVWIARLEGRGKRVVQYAKRVLRSNGFKPTSGVTTRVTVLRGQLFSDGNRNINGIRIKAKEMRLVAPNAEVACLIRELFPDSELAEMGLQSIVVMHEPIDASVEDPVLLATSRYQAGHWLDAFRVKPDMCWQNHVGFAFVSP